MLQHLPRAFGAALQGRRSGENKLAIREVAPLAPLSLWVESPVFWEGGSASHGHIAISAGNGFCWSTDIRRTGFMDRVPIDEIHAKWGLTLLGWTEDINGVTVPAEAVK